MSVTKGECKKDTNSLQKKLLQRRKSKFLKQSALREVPESVKKLLNYNDEFKKIFNVNVNKFADKLCTFGIPDFDIVAFDKHMYRLGYRVERDGCLAEYIESNYGVEGKELIDKLIELS